MQPDGTQGGRTDSSDQLPASWRARVASVEYAFQPIVNIHTGACSGAEALLRGVERVGFSSIQAFFDAANADGVLAEVSRALLELAAGAFAATRLAGRARLFFNVDNRELEAPGYVPEAAGAAMRAQGLAPSALCLEISERHQLGAVRGPVEAMRAHRARDLKIAIDDFGTGFSGLQLLYAAEPDFLKIDRFFVSDIATDPKKRLFVTSIVGIAHLLGITVIAEGVETLREYYVCRAVGCDLVQGYFVQPPTVDVLALEERYEVVAEASRQDRRRDAIEGGLIAERMQVIPPISVDTEMAEVLSLLGRDRVHTLFPVVSGGGEPLGLLRESDLRQWAYSVYGRDLLRNPSHPRTLREFVVPCPLADIHMSIEKILEYFSLDESSEGVLIVDSMRYVGFLDARALLQVIHERNLLAARDQNPLTRLPGNTVIYEYTSRALQGGPMGCVLAYLDFDHFKPFNDTYGFRAGDRAILMFAELLQKHLQGEERFVGHVGGDDFFVGLRGVDLATAAPLIGAITRRFADDVRSLYDTVARQRGYIEAEARDGQLSRFPLLGVSTALLEVPAGRARTSMDEAIEAIAQLKHAAKESAARVATAVLGADGTLHLPGVRSRPAEAELLPAEV